MKLFFLGIIFLFLPMVTLAQEKAIIDPQSMKLDQIKKGIGSNGEVSEPDKIVSLKPKN